MLGWKIGFAFAGDVDSGPSFFSIEYGERRLYNYDGGRNAEVQAVTVNFGWLLSRPRKLEATE